MKPKNSKYPVSVLINSVYFFLNVTLIIQEETKFRLLVIRNKKKIADKRYQTLKGARIGFHRAFRTYKYEDDMETMWSPFYNPEESWLEKLSNYPEELVNKIMFEV